MGGPTFAENISVWWLGILQVYIDELKETKKKKRKTSTWQFFVTFLGWLSDPFQRLSDLQLGDQKVTLNHLAGIGIWPARA